MDNHAILKAGAPAVLAIALAAVLPASYASNLLNWIAIAALIAASLRMVLLFGELNFGTAAFVSIGAYTAGLLTTRFELPFLAAILAAGLMAALVSILFGYVTLRIKGPYFKLIGFAFAEVVRLCCTQIDWLGGNSGMVGIFPPAGLDAWYGTFVMTAVVLMLAGLHAVERSDFGKVLTAIRDNDAVVRTVGIDVHRAKVICFAIACFAAGIAGSLQAFANTVISPGDFGVLLSIMALAYLKVGGEESIFGPVAGAALLILLGSVALSFGAGEHVFYGAAIVLSVLIMPKGIVGMVDGLLRRPGKPAASAPAVREARGQ
ncbi:branched-chain amino acid ABC transporter permease [Azospirillum endophyticum]